MKNLLLSAVVLATTTSALAQLYVAPNATAAKDSYIYAKNVQVYVDGTIRLVANTNDNTTKASFYLRDEAQLLQGGSNNDNSGDGFISVFQQGLADSYDYNAWTSPVSEPLATAGNHNFGEQSVFHSLDGLTNATAANFVPGQNGFSDATTLNIADKWFYRWNYLGQNFVKISDFQDVPPGEGFIMKGTNVTNLTPGDAETNKQLYDYRGRPNSGDISVTLPPSTTLDDGYTLTGNPYPSALDLNLFFYDNNGTGTTPIKFTEIQFYDEDRTINSHLYIDNKAGYGIWTPGSNQPDPSSGTYEPGNYVVPAFQNFDNDGNPTGTTGNVGPHVERRMSPIGQGFFIRSKNNTSNVQVTFQNSHRRFIKETNTMYPSEFRTSITDNTTGGNQIGGNQIDPTDSQPAFSTPQIRINTYMGASHMRQTLLILNDTATDEFDLGWDGQSPMDATSEMYFPLQTPFNDENKYPFVINAVPFTDSSKKVPFTLELEENMNVVITGIEEIDLPTDNVYVWDSLNDTYQNITGGESADFFLEEGTHTDRFYIVFRDLTPPIISGIVRSSEGKGASSVTFFQNNNLTQLEVANPDAMEITSAAIFDMRGRLVLNQKQLGDASRFTFNTGTFSDGTYIVILTTSDNQTIDYKIVVANR